MSAFDVGRGGAIGFELGYRWIGRAFGGVGLGAAVSLGWGNSSYDVDASIPHGDYSVDGDTGTRTFAVVPQSMLFWDRLWAKYYAGIAARQVVYKSNVTGIRYRGPIETTFDWGLAVELAFESKPNTWTAHAGATKHRGGFGGFGYRWR